MRIQCRSAGRNGSNRRGRINSDTFTSRIGVVTLSTIVSVPELLDPLQEFEIVPGEDDFDQERGAATRVPIKTRTASCISSVCRQVWAGFNAV